MDWISTGAAVLSVGVAVWAAVLTWRQNGLSHRLVEIEGDREQRAQADRQSAHLIVDTDTRHPRGVALHKLTVRNTGPAEARNVRVQLDGIPLQEHDGVSGAPDPGFPLAADAEVRCRVQQTGQDDPAARVGLSWDDDAGGDSYETTVTFTA